MQTDERPPPWYQRFIPEKLRRFCAVNENVTVTEEQRSQQALWNYYQRKRADDPAEAARRFLYLTGQTPEQYEAKLFDDGELGNHT